jgi:hypothetical protein
MIYSDRKSASNSSGGEGSALGVSYAYWFCNDLVDFSLYLGLSAVLAARALRVRAHQKQQMLLGRQDSLSLGGNNNKAAKKGPAATTAPELEFPSQGIVVYVGFLTVSFLIYVFSEIDWLNRQFACANLLSSLVYFGLVRQCQYEMVQTGKFRTHTKKEHTMKH